MVSNPGSIYWIDIFSHIFVAKKLNDVCLKRPKKKINEKEAGVGQFFLKKVLLLANKHYCWFNDSLSLLSSLHKRLEKTFQICSTMMSHHPLIHLLLESSPDAPSSIPFSVTRSGDLLDFGQLFKAFGNN